MNKKVFVRTKFNKFYNGTVIDIELIKDGKLLIIRDKFGAVVHLHYDDISELKEEGVDDESTGAS